MTMHGQNHIKLSRSLVRSSCDILYIKFIGLLAEHERFWTEILSAFHDFNLPFTGAPLYHKLMTRQRTAQSYTTGYKPQQLRTEVKPYGEECRFICPNFVKYSFSFRDPYNSA